MFEQGTIGAATTACQQPPLEPGSLNKLRILNLGDGTVLQLADDDIPDPPTVSFATVWHMFHSVECPGFSIQKSSKFLRKAKKGKTM